MRHAAINNGTAQLGAYDRADVLLGRADWVWADYIAEGRAEFDRVAARGESYNGERSHYARCFAEVNCPASKRFAAKAVVS